MLHDLRLHDGTEVSGYYPNANSWNKMDPDEPGPSRLTDNDVAFIRISKEQYPWERKKSNSNTKASPTAL